MKKVLTILFILIGFISKAQQYNPSIHATVSDAMGMSQATPTDGRSMFYVIATATYRNYASRAEALSYLYLSKYRTGRFPIYIDSAGKTYEYWFRSCTNDSCLVLKSPQPSTSDSTLLAPNYRVDTAKTNIRISIAGKLSTALNAGQIVVGNLSNIATPVTPGNDVSVTSGGSFTVLNQWKSTGNGGTTDLTNFIGTTDNVPLTFKVNNSQSGRIDQLNANVFWGYRSGRLTTAANNSTLGHAALLVNTSGGGNVAIGSQSLFNSTLGSNNTSIGFNSLLNNTIGGSNTVIGYNTGGGLSTGYYNTIIGANVTGLAAGLNNNIIVADGQGNKRFTVDSFGTSILLSTTALGLPTGNTSQRPSSPAAGYTRFNTDSLAKETFNGSIWVKDGGGGSAVVSLDSSRNAVQFAIKGTPTDSTIILSADSISKAGAYPVTDRKKVQRNEFNLSYAEMRLLTAPSAGVFYNTKINNIFAQFYWDATSTAIDDSVMIIKLAGTVTGRLLRYYADYVLVEWWGATGDGSTDDSRAFQKAINFAVSSNSHAAKIKLLGKTYVVNNVVVYKPNIDGLNYDFCTLTIEGPEPTHDDSQNLGAISILKSSIVNGFVLGFENVRNVFIRNIMFKGNLNPPSGYTNVIKYTTAQWLSGGIRNNANSPYAAIVIDPFYYAVAGGNQYPGMSSWYTNTTASGSSEVTFEGCCVRYFNVGVGVCLNGFTQNGDNISFRDGSQYGNRVFWASGQNQSRDNTVINLYSLGATQFLTNCSDFGGHQGSPPDFYYPSINGSTKYLYNFNGPFAQMNFYGGHTEQLYSLGVSSAGSSLPVSFYGTQLQLNTPANDMWVSPVIAEGGPINFYGGSLEWFDSYQVQGWTFNNDQINFNGTNITGGVPILKSTNLGDVTFNSVSYKNGGLTFALWEGNHTFGQSQDQINNKCVIPGMVMKMYNGVDDNGSFSFESYDDKIKIINTETSDSIAVDTVNYIGYFITSTPGKYQLYEDLITATAINDTNDIFSPANFTHLGFVYAISSDTIRIRYLPAGIVAGNYSIYITRIPRFYERTIGHVHNGTKIISGVQVAGSTGFTVGAFINGIGIPEATYVTAISNDTIFISQNGTLDTSGVALYDAKVRARLKAGYAGIYFSGDIVDNSLNPSITDTSNYVTVCVRPGITSGSPLPDFKNVSYGGGGGGSQDLQSVTTIGNNTTNQIQVGTGSFAAPIALNEVKFFGQSAVGSQINTPGYFNSTLSSAGTNFVVSNSNAGWYNNFVSVGVRGSTYPNNDYLTGSNAGLALVLAQGSEITRMALGTFNNVPLQLFSNNLERVTVFGSGNIGIGSTTDGSNGILQVTGRSRFTDTGSLAARFSYGSNIHSSFTRYSLIDKAYADSAYGSSSLDSLKLAFAGIGERPFWASGDTLNGKTIKGLNSVTTATGSDSTINIQLVNDTAIGTAANYYYGTNSVGRRGYYPIPTQPTSSTYTPTLSNTTNISGASLTQAVYVRVGNIVHVTIGGSFTPTTISTASVLTFDLPITTSNTSQQMVGSGSIAYNAGVLGYYGGTVTIGAATTGTFNFTPTVATGSTANFSFSFDYRL